MHCSPPSDMMRPRPTTEPRLPHNRSMGRVRFSRLGCPMFSNRWSNGLGCISSFWWCFAYLSNMTSWTYGTFKSSCRVKLDTYQGVIRRRIFDCAFCSIAWLDLLAQPQISMPYVQIGFIIILYIRSLFAMDSCDCLPSSQDTFFLLPAQFASSSWQCSPSSLTCDPDAYLSILSQQRLVFPRCWF